MQRLRIVDLVRGDDHRAHRAGPVQAFPLKPLGGTELEVARRYVIEDGVAKDMVQRTSLLDVPAAHPDHHP